MKLKLHTKSKTLYAFLMALFSVWGWGQAILPVSRTTWTGAEPTGWTQNGTTDRTSTSACTGNNALIFGNNNSWIQVNFDTIPDKLNFSLKKQGTSGQSKVTVEESVDAINWTTIGSYGTATGSVAISDCDNIEIALSPDSRYVKWTYTKATGNVDMDDVSITSGCLAPTFSFASATLSKTTADAPFTNVFTTNNTSTQTWSSSNTSVATVDSNGQVTIVGMGNTNIVVTQVADGTRCAVNASYQLTVTAPTFPVSATSNNTNFGTVSVSSNIITATPTAGYTYATPAYTIISGSATVTQNGNQFTVTPSAATEVQINFEAKPNYTLSLMNDGAAFTNANFPFVTYEGNTITLPTLANCGNYTFAGWDTNSNTTAAPTYSGGDVYNTTAGNVTLYAVYQTTSGTPAITYSYGFENNDTGWTSDATQSDVEAKLGTYSGRINTNNVHVTYDNIVASPSSITFSLKKTSTNNNYNIAVETSPDNLTWTSVVTYPMSDFTNGSWTEKTTDLSNYQNVYVRLYYYGTTAIRYIDDIRLVNGGFTTIYTTTPNCTATTTWNGTVWSNGTPLTNVDAIIEGVYSTISQPAFTANNITIKNGGVLEINGTNTINAEDVIVEDGGNLVIKDSGALNHSGTFKVLKNGSSVQDKYAFWSSPVASQNLTAMYSGSTPSFITEYDTATDYFVNAVSTTSVFAKGYSIKTPVVSNVEFIGVPNNGTQTFPLSTAGNGYNLVGNPYPSNLDLTAFYNTNSGRISNTFYFWDNTSNSVTVQGGATTTNIGYATYNPVSQIWTPAPNISAIPAENSVKIGQGFIVKATNAADTSLSFSNDMRTAAAATFYNKNNSSTEGKFWLRLNSSYNTNNTFAVAYINGASNSFDPYDSKAIGTGSDAFYTLAGTQKLVIQGRESFNINDVVPVGAKHFQNGNFTISLVQKEGIFNNGQAIYLHDKVTGTYTDLQNNTYSFAANSGDVSSRFEIVYKLGILSTSEVSKDSFEVYRNGENFFVRNNKNIDSVTIYDASGRQIQAIEGGSKEIRITLNAKGVYVVKAVSEGKEYTKKIMK
ncbi:T9SS type A sorting domain-containing protein [Chryseobacterium echinoideorum]|uniref:T9SS type A sorting domain-containing protein n=1 Tax=Chryseobacterium echinoideorum TaxID=1549648 RepID=UPI0011866B97|nr:T9SS type A sorting domain-containing protein [Chryseobacterium echinoideorum]